MKKKDLNWLHELATQKGGKCLATEYINSQTKCLWECHEGHRWWAMPNSIKQGIWCPHCSHVHSKPELQIFEFVKELHPDSVNGQKSILPNGRYELDIYVPSLRKAIEFDGDYWHKQEDAIRRDLEKNQQCQLVGIELLRIKESEFKKNEQQVFENIKYFLGTPSSME